ncbi:hypothetical protein BU24DRAFT_18983 [Aaosphaeria arxii CBS 175.79]|uniref:Uncharacterized protein n=1 Tax=Aaosphaeria arxii CBS 175.79 TaxID=1450172 RepID=A0A6A5Y7P0_9PLEO|nr:uncharacterized protein BU24DRAFT_18983 [Aaosphaeria arxii CBS 175.79]KAF2021309.1 hypothetical protein BU24DRAFT_18983 [Aaosphaeria arxii CBS 175.79]
MSRYKSEFSNGLPTAINHVNCNSKLPKQTNTATRSVQPIPLLYHSVCYLVPCIILFTNPIFRAFSTRSHKSKLHLYSTLFNLTTPIQDCDHNLYKK